MDAAAWEAVIPSMGYMALLRNLRNFDEAGVPDDVAAQVAARIADPGEVARSRQLPFRFLAAYRHAPGAALGTRAGAGARGVAGRRCPSLPGRTLVLVDRSGSMFYSRVSARSELTRADAAAVFGTALACARRAGEPGRVRHGQRAGACRSGASRCCGSLERFGDLGGTNTAAAVRKHYSDHDRVRDRHRRAGGVGRLRPGSVPADVPVYTWNLAGYRHGHGPRARTATRSAACRTRDSR